MFLLNILMGDAAKRLMYICIIAAAILSPFGWVKFYKSRVVLSEREAQITELQTKLRTTETALSVQNQYISVLSAQTAENTKIIQSLQDVVRTTNNNIGRLTNAVASDPTPKTCGEAINYLINKGAGK